MVKTIHYSELEEERILITASTSPHSPYHDHDFLELSYVVQGSAHHLFGTAESVLRQGDYFIVDYGVRHKYDQIGTVPFMVINCLFLPRLIDETLSGCRSFQELADNYLIRFRYNAAAKAPTDLIYHDQDGRIGRLFNRLSAEQKEKKPGCHEMMRCILIEILIETMRRSGPADPRFGAEGPVAYIREQAEKNFMEKISLAEMARKCCYSLAYVSKRFKAETGESFQSYLQNVRVKEACRLLANTPKKVSEIGGLVGYVDVKFFQQIFKKKTGLTPREYRNQIKKDRSAGPGKEMEK